MSGNNNKNNINCAHCKKALPESGGFVSCHLCKKSFHYSPCSPLIESSWTSMSAKAKAEWKCLQCRNNNKPCAALVQVIEKVTRSRSRVDEDDILEINNKKYRSDNTHSNMHIVQSDVAEIKQMIAELSVNMQNNAGATAKLNNTIEILSNKITELVEEGHKKDQKIELLEDRLNGLEQQLLCNNVEIINAPTTKTALETAVDIARAANMTLTEYDIENAYRIKTNNKLIIRFKSIKTKRDIIKKCKELKLTTNKIYNNNNNTNVDKKIFMNDELTAYNRNLLWQAKNKAKDVNWEYVWIKDGRILAKKNESARPIYIRKSSDINSLNE